MKKSFFLFLYLNFIVVGFCQKSNNKDFKQKDSILFTVEYINVINSNGKVEPKFNLKIKNCSNSVLKLPSILNSNVRGTSEELEFEILYLGVKTINYTDSIAGISILNRPQKKVAMDYLKNGEEKIIAYYLPIELRLQGKYKIRFTLNAQFFRSGLKPITSNWLIVEVK